MNQQLQLSWQRFAFCIIALSVIPAIMIATSVSDQNRWLIIGAIVPVFVSIFVFMGFGWARLRRANSTSPLNAKDFSQIFKHLIGPIIPATIWMSLTILFPIVFVFAYVFTKVA